MLLRRERSLEVLGEMVAIEFQGCPKLSDASALL
jgi:hypothetical protein